MMEELLAPKSPAPATISSLLLIITHFTLDSTNYNLVVLQNTTEVHTS